MDTFHSMVFVDINHTMRITCYVLREGYFMYTYWTATSVVGIVHKMNVQWSTLLSTPLLLSVHAPTLVFTTVQYTCGWTHTHANNHYSSLNDMCKNYYRAFNVDEQFSSDPTEHTVLLLLRSTMRDGPIKRPFPDHFSIWKVLSRNYPYPHPLILNSHIISNQVLVAYCKLVVSGTS